MKIGLISDAHLFHKYAITVENYNFILQKQFKNCDIIVDCGDLTDKSSLTAPQLEKLSKVYDNIDKPVYIIAGNHDSLSSTTVASIFNMKSNIKIITEPTKINNMLFVPYTDNIKELIKTLNKLDEFCNFAFSHLNITSNVYATIPFKNIDKLFKYAKIWFNGHIHTMEEESTAFGSLYNIGSCSNLTFGDEHIPCFSVYDTDLNVLNTIEIKDSIIHKNYRLQDNTDLKSIYSDISFLASKYKLCCKFYLQNNQNSLEIRKQIKSELESNFNILSISFDYMKDKSVEKKKEIKESKLNKVPLMQQLIQHFEEDTQISLSNNIKKELMLL